MIILITGVPGAGKSLYCVSEILLKQQEINEQLKAQGKEPRKIYVNGIPDLLIEHEPFDDENWQNLPDGSLVVIDEIQQYWRPAASRSALPDSIAQLETHRHRGFDIVIMTQHPMLVHNNVRNLVGKHLHLRRTALGVYLYEWSECVNPTTAFKNAIVKLKWSHPKKAFGLYKSAEIHNKVKFRIPKAVWMFGGAIACLVGAAVFEYNNLYQKIHPKQETASNPAPVPAVVHGQPPRPQGTPQQQPQQQQQAQKQKTEQDYEKEIADLIDKDPVAAFKPKFADRPETAPAYKYSHHIKSVPRLAGCVVSEGFCQCYTEQGTIIQQSETACKATYADMRYRYDPYSEPVTNEMQSALVSEPSRTLAKQTLTADDSATTPQ